MVERSSREKGFKPPKVEGQSMRKDKTKSEKEEVRWRNLSSLDIEGRRSGKCGCRVVVSEEVRG